MRITFVYRYADGAIFVESIDSAVACTDHGTGDPLGAYTLTDGALVGDGPLQPAQRDGIAALLVASVPA